MGTESEHVFVTELPIVAMGQIGKAILTKSVTKDLFFPIVKVVEYGGSMVIGEGPFPKPTFGKGIDDDFEYSEEQIGELLADFDEIGAKHYVGANAVTALPWGAILKILLVILGGLLAKPATEDDTADHPPA